MNLRFWEWDRIYNLSFFAFLLALASSVALSVVPVLVEIDAEGNEVPRTIWEEANILGALILVVLPVLIALSPLMVLSKAGGIGRQQLINLWLAVLLMAGYIVVTIQIFGIAYLPSAVFSLSAAVAATVRPRPTPTGRTAKSAQPRSDRPRGSGIRLSEKGRREGRRGRKDR